MANRGGPDRPLTDEELERKFRLNARRALPDDARVEALNAALGELERLPEVGELLDLGAAGV